MKLTCRTCEKPLVAVYDVDYVKITTEEGFKTVAQRGALLGYGYQSNSFFCSLRCGYNYAVRLLEAIK